MPELVFFITKREAKEDLEQLGTRMGELIGTRRTMVEMDWETFQCNRWPVVFVHTLQQLPDGCGWMQELDPLDWPTVRAHEQRVARVVHRALHHEFPVVVFVATFARECAHALVSQLGGSVVDKHHLDAVVDMSTRELRSI